MNFKLKRLILIGSYCPNRIVELDLGNHITINGENGAGKTTLLRLLPIFFGERPSNIIRGDAVVDKFSRYYFPTTASYVIYEYERRGETAMAVIHADGQKDNVVYRLIDSEYRPELFRDEQGVIQSNKLHTHLVKHNISESKSLSLHTYKQIIQNTAGREYKHLMSRFAFTGSTGRLTHMERIITGILQRITTFNDLKKMIVSSVMDGEELFSLRTSRKDLQHWIAEYEAYFGIMSKTDIMQELELQDEKRRQTENGFSKLHAKLKLVHDFHDMQVTVAEEEELSARANKLQSEKLFDDQLRSLQDEKSQAKSHLDQIVREIENLRGRRKHYDQEKADEKVSEFESLAAYETERQTLIMTLEDIQRQVKSITEVFTKMEYDAKGQASTGLTAISEKRSQLFEQTGNQKTDLAEKHAENLKNAASRQEAERETATARINQHRSDQRSMQDSLKTVQADAESLKALADAQEVERASNQKLQSLHDGTHELSRKSQQVQQQFYELEEQINAGELAVERATAELETLIAADTAGENTLLGFLRANRPEWISDIGRMLPEEILLRGDLSPTLAQGNNLYGVDIDLEKLPVGRFASEEELQREIKAVRSRLERKNSEVDEDRLALEKKSAELKTARDSLKQHEAEISLARTALQTAISRRKDTENRVENSKRAAVRQIQESLNQCAMDLKEAEDYLLKIRERQKKEREDIEQAYRKMLGEIEDGLSKTLDALSTEKQNIERDLKEKLKDIAAKREKSLHDHGVSTDMVKEIEARVSALEGKITKARDNSSFVMQYQAWLQDSWSRLSEIENNRHDAQGKYEGLSNKHTELLAERQRVLRQKETAIKAVLDKIDDHVKARFRANAQLSTLAMWPMDSETIASGLDNRWTVDALTAERQQLQKNLELCREGIRVRVEDIRRQMCMQIGTQPESFYSTALKELGIRHGYEHEWIEVFRTWFNDRHVEHRNSLMQIGRTRAQHIADFCNKLADFKRRVSTFATELKSNLDQGRIFDSISDVSAEIRAEVDTQDYWEAIQELHHEYDAWHAIGDTALPPPSFVAAAKRVASVVSDEKGLVADPVDLIRLKISANVNNQGVRTASNESELVNMSSNGLSYIILCVILIGFVNRIRQKESVVVPFVVDELKDLSYINAKTLLELLTRNNITMISAFPDVDHDLAELFSLNYKIMPGREIGLISLEDSGMESEVANV